MMTLNDSIKRRDDLVAAPMDDSLVMMDIKSGKYFNLSGAGNEIWKFTENKITVSDLISKLMEIYEVTREECERDTLEYLIELEKRSLIIVER